MMKAVFNHQGAAYDSWAAKPCCIRESPQSQKCRRQIDRNSHPGWRRVLLIRKRHLKSISYHVICFTTFSHHLKNASNVNQCLRARVYMGHDAVNLGSGVNGVEGIIQGHSGAAGTAIKTNTLYPILN